MSLKRLVCTLCVLVIMFLTIVGGYAAVLLSLSPSGMIDISQSNRIISVAVSIAVNIALYGLIAWSVKE